MFIQRENSLPEKDSWPNGRASIENKTSVAQGRWHDCRFVFLSMKRISEDDLNNSRGITVFPCYGEIFLAIVDEGMQNIDNLRAVKLFSKSTTVG